MVRSKVFLNQPKYDLLTRVAKKVKLPRVYVAEIFEAIFEVTCERLNEGKGAIIPGIAILRWELHPPCMVYDGIREQMIWKPTRNKVHWAFSKDFRRTVIPPPVLPHQYLPPHPNFVKIFPGEPLPEDPVYIRPSPEPEEEDPPEGGDPMP